MQSKLGTTELTDAKSQKVTSYEGWDQESLPLLATDRRKCDAFVHTTSTAPYMQRSEVAIKGSKQDAFLHAIHVQCVRMREVGNKSSVL